MANLPLPTLSAGVLGNEISDIAPTTGLHPPRASNLPVLLGVLREAIAAGTSSADSILAAVADSARVITGADGTAIASRQNGAIVCRARSGEIAPELGAPVSADSGISGTCLRTATTLVCNDVFTDQRVDTEVCLKLGIRSIAVFPLGDANGVTGILEAFSGRPAAFGAEQLDNLRALAEIAEEAYESEIEHPIQSADSAAAISATEPVTKAFSLPGTAAIAGLGPLAKRYWIVGVGGLALLLILLVVRLGWRQAGSEISLSESSRPAANSSPSTTATSTPQALTAKPAGGILPAREVHTGSIKSPLRNAAEIEPDSGGPNTVESAKTPVADNIVPENVAKSADTGDVDAPPAVEIDKANMAAQLIQFPTESQRMPQFGAPVSQGLSPAVLVRKVSPAYPPQALNQKITGSVVLDATVSTNGSVHKVKVISGPPLLAGAAAEAVREWRYSPAVLNGKAVETQQRVTVVFSLP
jgi:TonB family protein